MEYAFAGILSLLLNLYLLDRFSPSLVAGIGVFEAIENLPEVLCVGFCFLVTAGLGTRVGRIIAAASPREGKAAEEELHGTARLLTKGAVIGGLVVSMSLILLSRPITGAFFSGAGDETAVQSAVWLIRAYAAGFVFYLLNSELVCYYKLVEAFPLAHAVFFAEALAFPLLARIVLGEMFGVIGFCLGGALGEVLTFGLNLCFVWKVCGHFPCKIKNCRMEPYLQRLKKNERRVYSSFMSE